MSNRDASIKLSIKYSRNNLAEKIQRAENVFSEKLQEREREKTYGKRQTIRIQMGILYPGVAAFHLRSEGGYRHLNN